MQRQNNAAITPMSIVTVFIAVSIAPKNIMPPAHATMASSGAPPDTGRGVVDVAMALPLSGGRAILSSLSPDQRGNSASAALVASR